MLGIALFFIGLFGYGAVEAYAKCCIIIEVTKIEEVIQCLKKQ